jgi:hypothetical protein
MAIWQFRLILIPEKILLEKYDVLPLEVPMELAEDYPWWSDVQPPAGFEQQIDGILPRTDSWSSSMRMWGHKEGHDAYVSYVDESMKTIEEIAFRIDARAISADLVREICLLSRKLGCVLMTAEYELLAPDEAMVLTAVNDSTARKFVVDPVSTLQNLDHEKFQKRVDYFMNAENEKKNPPATE